MQLRIAISSGKGGTGKTFISTNLARVMDKMGQVVRYLDCDVEEPNGHLFLKPEIKISEDVTIISPTDIDTEKCNACGKCVNVCKYNALALIKNKILLFQNLCHVCNACTIICPENAISEQDRVIGKLLYGKAAAIDVYYALLKTGEGGMSPRLINKVKEHTGTGINILDSAPGTSCSVVETIKDIDLCVLVTDPTPFGINDLKLAVDMCRKIGQEPVIIVNRADYHNNDLKDYCKNANLQIIGEIPDERKIAECYSTGNLATDNFSEYHDLFKDIACKIIKLAKEKKNSIPEIARPEKKSHKTTYQKTENYTSQRDGKELVVISGKGGTGKTSLVAGFCALEKKIAISDCDVDAADLHLVLKPHELEKGDFSGGELALIDPAKCTACQACLQACKFNAITENENFQVDEMSCEGCGVCGLVCKSEAVTFKPAINGKWFISETKFGPMSHARLGIAEENSGKLVTLIRNKKNKLADDYKLDISIIDGSPGTGCPVIASITGTNYALIITEPTVSGIHDLKRVLDLINHFNLKSGIIVNKSDLNEEKTKEIQEIARLCGSDFLGNIPYNKAFTRAQLKGLSVIEYEESSLTDKIKEIWGKVQEKMSQT